MSISKQTTVWCDTEGCRRFIQLDVAVVVEARREARASDWRYYGGEDHCPIHSGVNK